MFTELPVGLVCQLPWDTQLSRTLEAVEAPRPAPRRGPTRLPQRDKGCSLRASACARPARPSLSPGPLRMRSHSRGGLGPRLGLPPAANRSCYSGAGEHAAHAFHTCTLENTPTLAVSTFLHWLHRCGLGAQHPVLYATHFPNLTDGSVLQLVFSVCFFKQHFVPFFWQNIQSIYKHFLYFLP